MITHTGWTWTYIDQHVTLPQVAALRAYWQHQPPAAQQLARVVAYLGAWLGIQPAGPASTARPAPVAPQTADQALAEAARAGIPVLTTAPNDPALALLDQLPALLSKKGTRP